jgi:transcriptional regulator with XRE-family HTH domain
MLCCFVHQKEKIWQRITDSGMEENMRDLDYKSIGMRIRQVRKAKGWSQDELAGKCGISMSFLGHIERGSRIMSIETLVRICKALDAGADELLWGIAHPSLAVLEMWNSEDKSEGRKSSGQKDSYSMYVRIMKSVAEIMNEA